MLNSTLPVKIGRYEIKSELGRGGMGTVYRCYDPHVKRDVAVKVLPREFLHDPNFRVRFEREAQTIALLEHQAIVPLYDFGEDSGQPYFVMRHMPGGSLADRARQRALTPAQAARIVNRLAAALDEVHAKGIIHRDLKPSNILFDQRDDPYISDFGIAKITQASSPVTGSGIIGTPAYMSPEQARGDSVIDGRSDIYALGAIVFEILTGRTPFDADTPIAVVLKHLSDPVPRLLDLNPDLPPGCQEIVERAMAKNRDERYQTAAELARALTSIATGEAEPLPPPTRPSGVALSQLRTQPHLSAPVVTAPHEASPQTSRAASPPDARRRTPAWVWALGSLIVVGVIAAVLLGTGTIFMSFASPTATLNASELTSTQVARVSETAQAAVAATAEAQSIATAQVQMTSMAIVTQTAVAQAAQTESAGATAAGIAGATSAALAQMTAEAGAAISALTTATAQADAAVAVRLAAPRIAFLNANDVWVVNTDGSSLERLTSDGGHKFNLRWMPDGRTVIYISGRCVQGIDFITKEAGTLTCFNSAEALDGFEVSPDSRYFAISLNRILYIGDYNADRLKQATSPADLAAAANCLIFSGNSVKSLQWSRKGEQIAIIAFIPLGGGGGDSVRLFNVTCGAEILYALDEFPALRFTLPKYSANPQLQTFGWDGADLFALIDVIRNESYGNLYVYNVANKKNPIEINPVDGTCCYADPQWSVDGSQFVFAFQDIRQGAESRTKLYYIAYGTIGTGTTYTSIPLPADFFADPRMRPQPAIAPLH